MEVPKGCSASSEQAKRRRCRLQTCALSAHPGLECPQLQTGRGSMHLDLDEVDEAHVAAAELLDAAEVRQPQVAVLAHQLPQLIPVRRTLRPHH